MPAFRPPAPGAGPATRPALRPTVPFAPPAAPVSQADSGGLSINLFPRLATSSPPYGASWSTDIQYPRTNQTITFFGFASDPDNDIATYAWNWGDGTTAPPDASDQAQHAYSSPGTYTVRLTVTDATAQSTAYENTIVVRDNWGPASVGVYPDTNAATYPKAGVSNTYDFYGYDQEQPFVDSLQWHIDWGDGSTTDPAASPNSPDQVNHTYANAGTYVIHYSATDQDTASHKTVWGMPMAVTVAAHPGPISVGWNTDVGTATTGQTVTFTGYATDPNGTGLTTYEWDWNGDGVYDTTTNDAAGTGSPGSSQATHSFAQPGTYAVGLRVTNSDGGTSTYSYTFSVTSPANGPVGYLYSDTGDGYYGYNANAGQAITFYADVYSLPNAVSVTQNVFHWGDGTPDTSTVSGQTQHTYAAPGTYRPSVTITLSNAQVLTVQYTSYTFDPNSPFGTFVYGTLQIVDNAPPDYAYAYVTNDTGCLHPNTSLGFTLVGNDPDGGHITTFDVDWNGDGTFDSTGIAASNDTATTNHTFTTDGHYTVIVRAHDSDSPTKAYTDLFDAGQVDITPDNCAPFGYVTHSPDQPQTNKSITFNASYSYDLDGTVASYQWDWNQDGTYDSTGVSATHTYNTDGIHYYTLKVTDNQGLSGYSTQSVETHTGNHLPQFFGLYISDTTPDTASTVYFDASGYDDDGTITQYKWDWDCNGTVDQTTSSPSTAHLYSSPGTYHPCVTLVDDDGGTVSSSPGQTYTVTVTAAVPSATIYWTPDEPHPGTTISFSAVASSPNGAINQYTWHWGDGTPDTVTTIPNANHAFALAGTYPVSVTVRDTTNATGTAPAQSVTVKSNWPPHAFFTASPQCTTTSTSITFDATGTYDSDNAVVSYHWDFNDGATTDTSAVTTTHSFSNPGTYAVTLVAKDAGNASSTAYERDITVQAGNCPPQDVYFTYSPQSLPSGSPISFTGHGVDPDGSIASYTWSWGDGTSDTISPTSGGPTTMHTFANPGLYTVQVIARDNLGLAGDPYALQIVVGVDTTPPTVTLTTPANASFTNDNTPTYSGTAGDDVNDSASVTVKIYSGSTVSGSPVQTRVATRSGTSWTIDGSPALPDGTYTAQAQQSDAANNTGFSAPHTFTVDTAPPTVTLTTPASSSSTNDTTPTYSGTASAGTGDLTTVVVNIYAGSSASGSPVQTLSPTRTGTSWTIDGTPPLAEGTYTAQASQSDAAGNTGTSAAHTFVIDTTAPVVTLVNPAASAQTNDSTPTYSGVAGNLTGDSTTVVVKIYAGSSASGSPVQTLSPTRSGTSWTIDGSPALADGTYTAQASQSDAAGNTGTSTAHTFVIDTTAPVVTLVNPAASAQTNDSTPTYSGVAGNLTGDSTTVAVKIYAGSSASGSPVQTLSPTRSGTSWTVDGSPALAAGTYTAQATQVDAAGNTGTSAAHTFVIDLTAPTITLTAPANGATVTTGTPAFQGVAGIATGDSASVTVNVYSGATATGSPLESLVTTRDGGTGAYSVNASPALPDGQYTAKAVQTDGAGNSGSSTANTFTINGPPIVTLTTPTAGAVLGDNTPNLGGGRGTAAGDLPTVTVKIYAGTTASGSPVQTLTDPASGSTWQVTAATLADGTYTAQASQSDASLTGMSAAVTFRIDTTPPAVTITAPGNGSSTTNTTPTFSGTAGAGTGDGATVTVKVYAGTSASGSPLQTLVATRSGTSWSVPAGTALALGTYTAQASQSDSAGNTGSSAASTFTIVTANHAPTCSNGTKTVSNATPTSITLTCTDADGDPLTLSIVAPPGHGKLGTIAAGMVTYTPTGTYAGPDSFTFKANDGKADSNVATISITVKQAPPPPPECIVPKLVGKTLHAAKSLINRAHCALGSVHHAASRKVKKGDVISQSRRPGHHYPENTKINLVLSRGRH